MGISKFHYIFIPAFLFASAAICRADDASPVSGASAPKSAELTPEEQAKVDAVIEAAKKEEPKQSHAIATIKSSGEKVKVEPQKKEPGKAVVTFSSKKEETKVTESKVTVKKDAPKKAEQTAPEITVTAEKSAPKPAPIKVVAVKPSPVKTVSAKSTTKSATRKSTPPKNIAAKNASPVTPKLPPLDLPKSAVQQAKAPVITHPSAVSAKASAPSARASLKVARAVVPPKPMGAVSPLSTFELGRYQYCGEDRDCMSAVNGCCDCANGGEDVAVNKERFTAFRARFACLDVACGEKSVEPTCASGVVSCVNHKCRYFSDSALDDKF